MPGDRPSDAAGRDLTRPVQLRWIHGPYRPSGDGPVKRPPAQLKGCLRQYYAWRSTAVECKSSVSQSILSAFSREHSSRESRTLPHSPGRRFAPPQPSELYSRRKPVGLILNRTRKDGWWQELLPVEQEQGQQDAVCLSAGRVDFLHPMMRAAIPFTRYSMSRPHETRTR
jgi:hypothetical protein